MSQPTSRPTSRAEPAPLRLRGLMHRPTVAVTGESLATYALLWLEPPDIRPRPVPLNLALVLDLSGSMYETDGTGRSRRQRLQDALRAVLDRLRPEDRLSLIAFGLDARVVLPSTVLVDKSRALSVIEQLDRWPVDPSGTALDQGLAAGIAELGRHSAPRSPEMSPGLLSWLVVLTDGETADEPICRDLAEHAASRSVGLTTVGLGMGWNLDLLADLSRAAGHGPCIAVDERRADGLRVALVEECERLLGIAWNCAELRLQPLRDVRLKQLRRIRSLDTGRGAGLADIPLTTEPLQPGQRVAGRSAHLGPLSADETAWLVEVSVPRRPEGRFVVFEATVNATDAVGQSCTSPRLTMSVTYAATPGGVYPEVVSALELSQIAEIHGGLRAALRTDDRPEAERLAEWLARKLVGRTDEPSAESAAELARELGRQVREAGQVDRRVLFSLHETLRRLPGSGKSLSSGSR